MTRTVWTRTTRLAAWGRSRSPPASWPVSSPSCCRRRWAGAQWSARLRSATSSRRPYWGDSTCGTQMIQCGLWPNGLTSSDSTIKYLKSWQDFCKVLFEVKKKVNNHRPWQQRVASRKLFSVNDTFYWSKLNSPSWSIMQNTHNTHTYLSSDDVHNGHRCIQFPWGGGPGTEDGIKRMCRFHCVTIWCHYWSSLETDEWLTSPVCGSPHLLTPCSPFSSWLPEAPPEA